MTKQKSSKTVSAHPETITEAKPVDALEFLSKWNTELMSFYTRRCQHYAMLPLQLASCSSTQDLEEVQETFLTQLKKDYRHEASQLSQIAGAMTDLNAKAEAQYAARLQKAQEDAAAILEQARAQAERTLMSAEEQAKKLSGTPADKERRSA